MELLNSAINETWKLCTLGGFLGLFLLTLLLTNNPQTVQISNSRSTVIAFISSEQPPSTASIAEAPSPSSITTIESSFSVLTTKSIPPTAAVFTDNKSSEHRSPTAAPEAVQHETSGNSSSPDASTSTAPLPEDEPAANFNSTEFIQSLNSSASLEEEKLFTSTGNDTAGSAWAADEKSGSSGEESAANTTVTVTASETKGGGEGQKCKLYEGRWVYKPEENPRYRVYDCPFLEEKMSCQKNGRPDFEYEGWSWESDGCQIPLFDAKDMLEKMRGKRMLIAGDSLNRNKWESLACLLYSALPRKRVYVDAGGPAYKVLKALDYGFTLEFYWAPFLVHFNEEHKSGKKTVILDELVPSSKQWIGADVMVFNSGHWWTHDRGPFKPWQMFEYGGEQVETMQTELAYSRALSTWSDWLAHNVDPTKTKVYFRSVSPEHKNKNWCFNATRPIQDGSYIQLYPRSMIEVVEGKLREINGRGGVHINYLNITNLSTYRRDAHPSIFRFKHWKIITQKYKRLLPSKSDCSHWCLPGLPDTWNRILYASLFFDDFTPGDLSVS